MKENDTQQAFGNVDVDKIKKQPKQVRSEPGSRFFNLFHIKERGSTPAREILAGIIVFLAMIYILPVNSNILGAATGVENDPGVFVATGLCSFICCMVMGLIAGYPVMLSAGMGMNAFIAFTVCGSLGYTWPQALVLILVAGLLFLAMTLTPIREWIINAIPADIKKIISAGLGCFIAFVGLKGAGIVTSDASTLVTLGDFTNPSVLLALFGIILVFILSNIDNKWVKQLSIAISVFATAIVGLIMYYCFKACNSPIAATLPHFESFADYGPVGMLESFKKVFGQCFNANDWKVVFTNPKSIAVIFILIFVNLFDTTATLVAVGKDAGFMDEKGQLKGGNKAMIADAVGAVICAPLGTSTCTSFAESSVGIECGARTGLSAVTTGFLFLISILLYPIFAIFSYSSVTCLALVSVGAIMVSSNFKEINWDDKIMGATAFITVIMIILTYSISTGLGFGLILYCLMMLVSKRGKEVNVVMYVIAGFFVLNFIVNAIL
ncbi:MAG: NCS2 family permease [Bacilli bacterium]|nr:NCS2 family permease [Bacilli bacterium]